MKVERLLALRTGCLYSQKTSLVLISFRGWFDLRAVIRPERLSQWKISMTLPGKEAAAFRLVSQCFYLLYHSVQKENTFNPTFHGLKRTSKLETKCNFPTVTLCWRKFCVNLTDNKTPRYYFISWIRLPAILPFLNTHLSPWSLKAMCLIYVPPTLTLQCLNFSHSLYFAHETSVCPNPPVHNFTGGRNNLTDPQ